MKIEQLLRGKNRQVVTVMDHSVIDTLVHRLRQEKIGAVVVSDDDASVHGIISERDVINALAEYGPRALQMTVGELMTKNVTTCGPDDDIRDIMHTMTQRRVRHIPVTRNGRLIGLVSIGDVVKNRLEDMEMEANVLRDYIAVKN